MTNSGSRQANESDNITQQGTEFIQYEATQVRQVVTRQIQPDTTPSQLPTSPNRLGASRPITAEKQILVIGGFSKSYEIFNWSTQRWTLYEDTLFFDHEDGFLLVYDNKVMICGGKETNSVEYVDPTCFGSACAVPVKLPRKDCGKGVLFGDKILTFGQDVIATSLKTPFQTTYPYVYMGRKCSSYGVAYTNENDVVIVGGYVVGQLNTKLTGQVSLYNPTTKTMTNLAPLPYKLHSMAVVVHKDNVIILGGCDDEGDSMNNVLMYNITTQECRMLPKMLRKRYEMFLYYLSHSLPCVYFEQNN